LLPEMYDAVREEAQIDAIITGFRMHCKVTPWGSFIKKVKLKLDKVNDSRI